MEINFNANAGARFGGGIETAEAAAGAKPGPSTAAHPAGGMSNVTITHGIASPEDVAAAEIPEAEFSRTDALGKLVGSAFALPPPPMPAFDAAGAS
ncbi:MAG: hypothetical protein IJS46_02020 [Kiritimatiellae bacterium]|nr:hypothetical protein [Kiritimatiellia bacterium]